MQLAQESTVNSRTILSMNYRDEPKSPFFGFSTTSPPWPWYKCQVPQDLSSVQHDTVLERYSVDNGHTPNLSFSTLPEKDSIRELVDAARYNLESQLMAQSDLFETPFVNVPENVRDNSSATQQLLDVDFSMLDFEGSFDLNVGHSNTDYLQHGTPQGSRYPSSCASSTSLAASNMSLVQSPYKSLCSIDTFTSTASPYEPIFSPSHYAPQEKSWTSTPYSPSSFSPAEAVIKSLNTTEQVSAVDSGDNPHSKSPSLAEMETGEQSLFPMVCEGESSFTCQERNDPTTPRPVKIECRKSCHIPRSPSSAAIATSQESVETLLELSSDDKVAEMEGTLAPSGNSANRSSETLRKAGCVSSRPSKSFSRPKRDVRRRGRKKRLTPKEHRCTECTKSFSRLSSYKIHHNIHTGAKTFNCEICFREFNVKSNLTRHLKLHGRPQGVRPSNR